MAKARHIDETEFRRAVAVVGSNRYPERDKLCLLLTGRAGMRVNEIRMLDVSDVYDRDLGEVRDRIHLSSERVKWGHTRDVHLNTKVQKQLEIYLAVRGLADGSLILTQSKVRFSRTHFCTHYSDLYRKAGIETSSHAGRALFIHTLADNGVSIRIIQKAVGHKSLAATNAYLSARPQEVKNAVELLK